VCSLVGRWVEEAVIGVCVGGGSDGTVEGKAISRACV